MEPEVLRMRCLEEARKFAETASDVTSEELVRTAGMFWKFVQDGTTPLKDDTVDANRIPY